MHDAFTDWEPRTDITRALLEASVLIIEDYGRQGYQLTLRQLYYQLVSRDIIPNRQEWYKRLGDVISKGRMGGHIDWNAIVDRGRTPVKPPDWSGPGEILRAAASQFRLDRWEGQEFHVEVWCEKDALAGVIEPVCRRNHVRFMANRGYSSSTAMYDAAQRFLEAMERRQDPVVIYLGDHDPSGLDMSRDITDRLYTLTHDIDVEVVRLALNYDQVQRYNPPPNPTKLTDSRAPLYVALHGRESWELDALDPAVLDALVEETIGEFLDRDLYAEVVEREESARAAIREAALRMESGLGRSGTAEEPGDGEES